MVGYHMGNGLAATIQRNARQLTSNLVYAQGGNGKFNEAYTYDANGNLTGINDLIDGSNSQTLGYDALNRLASAVAPHAWGTESYTYDPLNNVRSKVAAGLNFYYNYDGSNRLASTTLNSPSPTGSGFSNYQYDGRGNQTHSNVVFTSMSYNFDMKNQLLQIPGVATYSYDDAGRRYKKVLANGQVNYFFYSQAGQLMYAYDASSGQATDYLRLNGQLIARYRPGQAPIYLLNDRLGTPVRETNAAGAVTASFSYRPYGGLYSGPNQGEPGFTGHVNDPETALTYMQARYYDAGMARMLSVDPVGPVPGNLFGFNRYAYADNNPIVNIDPTGMCVGHHGSDDPCNPEPTTPRQPSPTPKPEVSPEVQRMRNTADHGGIWQKLKDRSSFTTEGAAALGGGVAVSATKEVGKSADSLGGSFVMGEGGMVSATYNLKVWAGAKEASNGFTFAADPSSYLRIKLGAGLALGAVVKTDPYGAHDVSIVIGGGIGEEVIYKPPVNVGLNYNIK